MKALQAIAREPWAILPDALEQILAIAQREAGDPEALAARLGRPLDNTRTVTMRDGVAVVPVIGPIFQRANLFTEISGATSIELLARDFTAALDDPAVRAIALEIDSPGGQVAGTSEFADMVYQARGQKPITAYISARGASGAYWIASAADRIVVADTALVGSIGVVSAIRPPRDDGSIEIVSSRAPNKRIDIASDDGRAQVQALVDRLETVFIDTVARNRGLDADTVVVDFGAGGLLVGSDAVDAGMADAVGSFESILAGLAGPTRGYGGNLMPTANQADQQTPAITLDLIKSQYPDIATALRAEGEATADDLLEQARTEGASAERERIQAVFEQGQQLRGHDALIQRLMFDGTTSGPQAAVQILAAEKQARGTALADLRADAPRPAPAASDEPDSGAGVDKSAPIEERCKAEWNRSQDLRAEFGSLDAYTAFKRAEESGRVRVLSRKAG